MTKKFAVSAGSDCHHGTSDRRGIVKKLHERYPNVNIQTVEYDYEFCPDTAGELYFAGD